MLTMGGSIYDGKSAPGAQRKFTGARSRVSVFHRRPHMDAAAAGV